MNANYRRTLSRNYSGRSEGKDEIDAALDDLGNFSYLDGIPFELDRGIQSALETARIHMNKAEALLATPLPSSLNQSTKDDSLLDDIGRVERQVLEQLKQIEAEREKRKRKKEEMIKEYEEKKKETEKIKAQKLLEEQELKSKLETNSIINDDNTNDQSCDKTNETERGTEAEPGVVENEKLNDNSNDEAETTELKLEENKIGQVSTLNSNSISPEETIAASTQPETFLSQNSAQFNETNHMEPISSFPVTSSYLEPSRNNTLQLIPSNQNKSIPTQGLINFSEFENEPDPFEKAELQTLNDMQELASVFPQSNNINTNVPSAVSSNPNSSLGLGQQQYVQSKGSMMSTTSNKLPSANQAAINNFQYPQFPQPPANPSGQFNPYLHASQSNSSSHPNSAGSFYTQGLNVQSSLMSSSNSNRQAFSPNNMYNQEITSPYIPPYQAPTSNASKHMISESEPLSVAETLKTSKSVGDLMSEIQKETETMMLETKRNNAKQNTKESVIKKSRAFSQTPPPSKSVCTENIRQIQPKPNTKISQGQQSAFEDWIPWPDIDGLPSTSKKKEASEISQTINPLEGLSTDSSAKCKQLHDMGFPLERLGKACRAIGNDEQKLINYCLFVDKILEDSSISVKNLGPNSSSVVEDVVLIHSSDDNKIRKHLEAFSRLIEFGFEPPSKIHTALTECDLNYEKALEQMLK